MPDQSFSWLSPVVDGWILPRTPLELLHAPDRPRIPSIIGTNARELPLYGANDIDRRIRQMFGANAHQALKLYQAPPTPEVALMGSLGDRVAADVMFRCPAELVARLRETHGSPVWRYQLSVGKPGSAKPVEHSSELPFVFDPPGPGDTQTTWPPLQLYWTNFAKTGDPNGPGLPPWPRYDARAAYVDFTPGGAQVKFGLRKRVCELLSRP